MNLMEGILQELERNRELLQDYEDIGQPGQFGASIIAAAIKQTENAIMEEDTVEMLRCYKYLQDRK